MDRNEKLEKLMRDLEDLLNVPKRTRKEELDDIIRDLKTQASESSQTIKLLQKMRRLIK